MLRRTVVLPALALALIVCLAGPARAFLGLFSDAKELTAENGSVSFPAAEVADGKAHFFTATTGGKTVRFFAVKTPDGRIRLAFDACEVCYPEKKGYRQEGEFMVCANCGRRFHLGMVGEVRGGCNPSPLKADVADGKVVVAVADLTAGAELF